MESLILSDGVAIRYDYRRGESNGPTLIFLHGWSGSSKSFAPCLSFFPSTWSLLCMDFRFHGASDKPEYGFHVARLAADTKELIEFLSIEHEIILIGASMGAAVIWSMHELFFLERLHIHACVFVDQAPLQNRRAEWTAGSLGCYDEDSLLALQHALMDIETCFDSILASCVHQKLPSDLVQTLFDETKKCRASHLGQLMRDHTQLDWRPVLPTLRLPCLSLFGQESRVFPQEGLKCVQQLLPNCTSYAFPNCGHWLYLEDPQQFARVVRGFVEKKSY